MSFKISYAKRACCVCIARLRNIFHFIRNISGEKFKICGLETQCPVLSVIKSNLAKRPQILT